MFFAVLSEIFSSYGAEFTCERLQEAGKDVGYENDAKEFILELSAGGNVC